MAFHLGWIRAPLSEKIDAFRKIRNEFAHNAYVVNFDTPEIVSQIKRIDYDLKNWIDGVWGESAPPVSAVDDNSHTLFKLAFLALQTFTDLLILPTAIAHRVAFYDIAYNYSDAPRNYQELFDCGVRSMLIALGSDWKASED